MTARTFWELVNEAEDRTSENGTCPTNAAATLSAFVQDVGGFVGATDVLGDATG